MADCSYARCLQERRLIKRELLKHSKDMLQIVVQTVSISQPILYFVSCIPGIRRLKIKQITSL
ncbi:mushroom body large-type Kenyon cell-specific protein 1-like [Glossina fuscipes fuscipes]